MSIESEFDAAQYFEKIKENIKDADLDLIKSVNESLYAKIREAKSLNQLVLLNKLLFTFEVTQKEMVAVSNGFNRYISKDLLQEFIGKVTPKNSVKVIELERYPRVIPEINALDIKRAKNINAFDRYAVIFTDLEDVVKNSTVDTAFIARNKDPIVVGYFYNEKYHHRYDRYYIITDWVDEFCDLTFDSMVRKMSEMNIETTDESIGSIDIVNLQSYVDKNIDKMFGGNRRIVEFNKPVKKWWEFWKK